MTQSFFSLTKKEHSSLINFHIIGRNWYYIGISDGHFSFFCESKYSEFESVLLKVFDGKKIV